METIKRPLISLPPKVAENTYVNFARCEIDSHDAKGHPLPVEAPTVSPEAHDSDDPVRVAFETCDKLAISFGAVEKTKWSKQVHAMLPAVLDFVVVCERHPGAIEQVRQWIKTERKGLRAPKVGNLELTGLQLCCLPTTPPIQKELSRLAKLAKLARHEEIAAANVSDWLAKRTLAKALRDYAALKDRSTATGPVTNPIKKAKYPRLAEVLSNKHDPLFDRTSAEIAEALQAINSRLETEVAARGLTKEVPA